MIFVRDDADEHHEFVARPRMGWQDVKGLYPLMGGSDRDDGLVQKALGPIDRLIRRSLRNDDGTPEKWVPNVVHDEDRTWFTDPNGDHIEGDNVEELLPAYLAFDSGSSRRRWVHLMEHDDDVTIEPGQIMDLLSDLTEQSGKGRSPKLAGSSG
ncbi:MAG: hypothetical protein ACRDTT_00425 [Pseudonocardiaceae bacterium]